jgi:hypothetical protein
MTQTGFTPRPGQPAAPAARPANAPISMAPAAGVQPRPAIPNQAQPQRAAIPVAADAGRTGFHPPGQATQSAPLGMAPTHAPSGPKIQHGHGVPQGGGGHGGHGGHPGTPAPTGGIQMMRPQEPSAPPGGLAGTGFNRPLPTAAARPAPRPPTPRPPAQRTQTASKSAATPAAPEKKKFSTTMLVVVALVVGAVVAFAVLS